MIGKVLFRLGIAAAVAVISAVQSVLQGFDFSEFGLYAGLAGLVAGVVATLLGELAKRLPAGQ